MKKCSKCLEIKQYSEFYKRKGSKDGHRNDCKVCRKEQQSKRYHSEEGKAVKKAYQESEQGKITIERYQSSDKFKKSKHHATNKWRAEKAGNPYAVCSQEIKAIKEVYSQAMRLSEETGIPHEVDHIIPICKGGSHTIDNIQILTRQENRAKGHG